ncbi:SRPBCC family protein [Kitasatospora sp. NPDC058243]|uniref:SRPBCC family protein n=1 Tax=Kitasatospora sp. NPDC058243 TaxID=3346397 RepID=UPI0036DD412C
MHTYDLINEAIIHAPTHQVWNHLIAELNGTTTWWTPHNTHQPGNPTPEHPGGTTHITIHPNGHTKPGPKIHTTATTTHTTPPHTLTTTHTGHFTGTTTYTLTPTHNNQHTKLTITFTTTPHGWPTLLPKHTIPNQHTKATHNALTNLNHQLTRATDTTAADRSTS